MNCVIGVCLGASTISFAKVKKTDDKYETLDFISKAHNGDVKETFQEIYKTFNKDNYPIVATGRKFREMLNFSTIAEPVATENAFNAINTSEADYSAIASLGGETFLVYTIDAENKISDVITKNQCASGTGEFFMQQIKRMDLNPDEATEISRGAKPFHVSGRCSVFCKSDCTHALNKGVPKSEVSAGLSLMIADKIDELLKKVRNHETFMLIGGVTKNEAVMTYINEMYDNCVVPEEAAYFEAYGAAVYGLKNDAVSIDDIDHVFVEKDSSFDFLSALEDYKDKVVFKEADRAEAQSGDRCILGLDVGSTSTKAVIIRESDNKILASVYLYTNGNPIKAARDCYKELKDQIKTDIHIYGLGVTGSGRAIAGLHALTDGVINEIIAHATAAVYFDSEVDTIFEIGGQDAKYTYIVNKVPADYAMNEACSAGTGSFIEESAFESLGIKVKDIEAIAMKGTRAPNFNDQCAAFISSDIKTAQQEGISKEDIVAGLVYSICMNYVNRVKGNRTVGKKIFMQGGVCYNKAIPIAMAALTGNDIIVPPDPGLMGAFGVALEVKEKVELGLIEEDNFILSELIEREVEYKKPFICYGGGEDCDRRCSVNMIEVNGKKYPFGGACNKYYNIRSETRNIKTEDFDFVQIRQELTFEKYASKKEVASGAQTVGINRSLMTHNLFPLYHNFFTELGYKVVMSEEAKEEALDREFSSFCYPEQLSLCMFKDLLDKKPDYIFVPHVHEMYVSDKEEYRIDFHSTCVFVAAEPYILKQAFKDYEVDKRLLKVTLNFAPGFFHEEEKFVSVAKQLGINDESRIREAYRVAVDKQLDYQAEKFELGRQFLETLEQDPDDYAMVLVGRSYNTFAEEANKGIPQKFASRGVKVLPFDFFDYRNEELDDNMYLESGQKILKMASFIKKHPQLFATYVSNFSCGPDSMIMPRFRNIMGTKPSLTLELDSHSADAGINTRIEAALDIISNYRKMQDKISDPKTDYVLSRVHIEDGEIFFHASDGNVLPISDPRVKIIVPNMGDLSSTMFTASLKSLGYNCETLPQANNQILKYARANTSGKECLPVLLMAGSLVDYIENRRDAEYVAFFNIQGGGNCRLGQYPPLLRDVIRKNEYHNVATFELMNDDGFAGLGPDFAKLAIQNLMAADVLDDVRSALLANSEDPEKAIKVFDREYATVLEKTGQNADKLYDYLEDFSAEIAKIPARIPINESKYVALVGEIYCRRDGFSHKWLNQVMAQKGFVLKTAYVSEWVIYVDYLLSKGLIEADTSIKGKTEQMIRTMFMKGAEKRIKKTLARSGYYEYRKTEIEPLLEASAHILPVDYKGEPGLTLGVALHETLEHYCGVINIGPFGCMPTRFAESLTVPEMTVESKIKAEKLRNPNYELSSTFNGEMTIPFLTLETDGNPFPQVIHARLETFSLQAERIANLMLSAKPVNKKSFAKKIGKLIGK